MQRAQSSKHPTQNQALCRWSDYTTVGIGRPPVRGDFAGPLFYTVFKGEHDVTKKDIVRIVSEQLDLTQLLTKDIVQKTFDVIIDALVESGRIELRNFGVFEVKRRAARTARNPKTNQEVKVGEKFVVSFKPGKEMEVKVQGWARKKGRKAKK